mgnify:CR=1 FL=1
MAANRLVYFFGDGKADGKGDMKNLLGGKGANLAEMVSLGVPVPPGFTVTTEQCIEYGTQVVGGVTPGRGGQEHLGALYQRRRR